MNKLIPSLTMAAAVALTTTACSGNAAPTTTKPASDDPSAQTAKAAAGGSTKSVSDVFGMHADWDIPDTVSDVVRAARADIELLGVPTSAFVGNEYTFDEGRGGSILTAYFTVEVTESSSAAVAPGDIVTVELPMPWGTTAESLASIGFDPNPWAFAVTSEGVFAGGDITGERDLDDQANPSDVLGGTNATAVFEVTAGNEVVLPIINEPALEKVDVASTSALSDQIESEINGG